MTVGQVNSHGVHRKIAPPKISFYRQRMIKHDLEIAVSYASGDLGPWERYVNRRAIPAMGQ
jgi:hypothetical protein